MRETFQFFLFRGYLILRFRPKAYFAGFNFAGFFLGFNFVVRERFFCGDLFQRKIFSLRPEI